MHTFTREEELKIAKWLEGDIYLRNGLGVPIDSKDTDYDKMVESPDYVFQDQAYIPESVQETHMNIIKQKIFWIMPLIVPHQ